MKLTEGLNKGMNAFEYVLPIDPNIDYTLAFTGLPYKVITREDVLPNWLILRFHKYGQWTWDEMQEAIAQARKIINLPTRGCCN